MPARFMFHDLLRAYAADQAEQHDTSYERRGAVHRVLDHYLHTAMAAALRFSPHRPPLRPTAPQPGVMPADVVDKEQATAWFEAEAPVLLALIGYSDANGFDGHAWKISWTLGPFFHRHSRLRDYVATQTIALEAARRLEDPVALGHSHYLLGHAQAQAGDYRAADPNFRQALDMFRRVEDRANEAVVLNGLAGMLEKQERYTEALAVALDALRMLKSAGYWWTQATLENGVGWLYAHLGQYDQALTYCQRALSLHRESGYRGGTADTLDSLGYVYLRLADFSQAKAHYAGAVEVYREIGSLIGQGNSLGGLGDALLGEGSPVAAAAAWREAITILDRLPHPLADEIRVRLRALGSGEDLNTRTEAATTARSV
jgi:tetratricopeptide (TPR) repeat protein